VRRTRTARGVSGGALTKSGAPYYIPTKQPQTVYTPSRKPLADMTQLDMCQHLEDMQARLQAKQKRERAYLDRRAARGTDTPTDEAYRRDQVLEDELLEMIAFVLSNAGK
jgi:propanediol dehydratase small subunit